MNWETLLSGAVGAGIFAVILKIIDIYSTRSKTKSDTIVNIAEAAGKLAQGGKTAVEAATDLLSAYDKLMDEQSAEIGALKQQLSELEAGRQERTRLIQQLQSRIEADLLETQNLKNEVILLRKQVADGEQKLSNYKQAIELMIGVFKEKGWKMPPELEFLLGDSIHGLKWPKPPE